MQRSQKAANVCTILPSTMVSNRLIFFFKLQRDLKYRGHVYFKPICKHIIYQEFTYLPYHVEFYEDISIAKGFQGNKCSGFLTLLKLKEKWECYFKNDFEWEKNEQKYKCRKYEWYWKEYGLCQYTLKIP